MRTSYTSPFDLDTATTHRTTPTSLDRYVTRIKIEPTHKAIVALHPSSQYNKDLILKIIVLSDYYGVKPNIMNDIIKINSIIVPNTHRYIDCLDNVRIYQNMEYNIPVEKTCYHYNLTIKNDEIHINQIFKLKNQPKDWNDYSFEITQLPKIRKGKYSLVERYQEFLKVVNERRKSFKY